MIHGLRKAKSISLKPRGDHPQIFDSNFHFGTQEGELETDAFFNGFEYEHDEKLSDCFHLYELEWSQNQFIIKFDGSVVKTYDEVTYTFVDDFFNKKHRLVLNLAIGGMFFQDLDSNRIPNESYLVVDWVRVYEK